MPVPSLSVPLGSRLPWFEVEDLSGRLWTTSGLAVGHPVLIAFLCNHSPYVRHIERSFARVARWAQAQDVIVLGVASNDTRSYPSDGSDMLRAQTQRAGFDFPYCLDATQRMTKSFAACCTPEFFLYDEDWRLVYHGQYDDSRPGNAVEVTGADLVAAIESTLRKDLVPPDQTPSFGCSVKWRAGNEPAYLLVLG